MGYSTPNRMVWLYFSALQRRVQAIQATGNGAAQADIALCLMLTVAVVETFLNLFFRVAVSEPAFAQHKGRITRDLERRASLDHKLRRWPEAVFGRPLDPDDPILRSFFALKEKRNRLMHFTSTHETFAGDGFQIEGLTDTSVLDDLAPTDALTALQVAEDMMRFLLRHRGVAEAALPAALHMWTGQPPLE
ncbi:hypothetical protein TSA1_19730 [Bradyrhizobium nitroreducens]|uniref:Uncharacterized protein n=1 Tax=Bradyrhizobium nitroreducens TaxID=709803 RepID=A0A2M6UDT0_9BRAD|nr:hypothetical protein [Bradyrhizobium nitroreducens]PIT02733.1 hypothetical protein TSA1_19730 [Bradyrhizobium nitroreducens]